jgi:hypothetical protein
MPIVAVKPMAADSTPTNSSRKPRLPGTRLTMEIMTAEEPNRAACPGERVMPRVLKQSQSRAVLKQSFARE